MNRRNIVKLAGMLGSARADSRASGWVSICCPFAPWHAEHKSGADEHPSLGIQASEGCSRVNCLTCRIGDPFKPELIPMLWHLENVSGKDMSDIIRFVHMNDTPSMADLDARDVPDEQTQITRIRKRLDKLSYSFAPIPVSYQVKDLGHDEERDLSEFVLEESELEVFRELSPVALDYLHGRDISDAMIAKWEIGWHPYANRIVIPIRDRKGRLVGLSGRSIDTAMPKYLHSNGYPRDYVLYGEHQSTEGEVGYLTEGFFDVHRLHLYGYTTAEAVLGTHLSKHQARSLVRRRKKVVLLMDGDGAGQQAAQKAQDSFAGLIETEIVVIPHGKDPDNLTKEEAEELLGTPKFS